MAGRGLPRPAFGRTGGPAMTLDECVQPAKDQCFRRLIICNEMNRANNPWSVNDDFPGDQGPRPLLA